MILFDQSAFFPGFESIESNKVFLKWVQNLVPSDQQASWVLDPPLGGVANRFGHKFRNRMLPVPTQPKPFDR
jgi:hypothetical protein